MKRHKKRRMPHSQTPNQQVLFLPNLTFFSKKYISKRIILSMKEKEKIVTKDHDFECNKRTLRTMIYS